MAKDMRAPEGAGETGAAPAAPAAPAPSTPAPPAATGSTRAITQQDLQDALDARDAAHARELRDIRALLEGKPVAPAPDAVAKAQAKLDGILGSIQSASDAALATLREGPHQFNVNMDGEPRMNEVVGAVDELHAEAKFRAYYGIRAVLDPDKKINVGRIEKVAATAPEPAAAAK